MKTRSTILWFHRWIGLGAGGIIAVLAITGALMVWDHGLDAALNPQLLRAPVRKERVSLDAIVARFRELHPKEGGVINGMRLPGQAGETVLIVAGGGMIYSFDPATGGELGSRRSRDGFVHFVTELHLNLMMGKLGSLIVGIVTALTLAIALSGLWLWWPLRIVWFRNRPTFRWLSFDLHNMAGLYSSIFLIVVTFTGVTMSFERSINPWIHRLTGSVAPVRPPVVEPKPNSPRVSLDDVVRRAELSLPGATTVSMGIPRSPRGAFRVQLRFPEDRTPGGRSLVFIDPYSGEALQVSGTRGIDAGNWYIHFSHSLHTGEIAGFPTRLIAFLVCLALVAQIISGVIVWWVPRRTASGQSIA